MNTTLVEGSYGHGGLDKKFDFRDFKYKHIQGLGYAPLPFLWTDGFDIETKLQNALKIPSFRIPVENQFQSFSCGGQAVRYYAEVLKALKTGTFERLSAHDPYCQIFYPQGGTTIRDVAKIAVQTGIKSEAVVSSYQNGMCTEAFMEDRSLTNASPTAIKFSEFGFAFPSCDIETVASAIRDNNGCIIQVTGYNNGTWLSPFPSPVAQNLQWSHFLYAGKAKMINGKRYIGVINSWGVMVGDAGWQWLGEEYFKGGVANTLVFYDQTLYQYVPPVATQIMQVPATWLQKFLNFFSNYFPAFPQ